MLACLQVCLIVTANFSMLFQYSQELSHPNIKFRLRKSRFVVSEKDDILSYSLADNHNKIFDIIREGLAFSLLNVCDNNCPIVCSFS